MTVVCIILGILCLAYYALCALYAGVGSSFIFIWLIGAAFFFITGGVRFVVIKNVIVLPAFVGKAFVILLVIGIVIFCGIEACIISHMLKTPEEDCDYLIVLGCQIRGNRITKSLRKRLDTAYEYASVHKETRIIVSGGQGEGENLTEALAMQQYLVEKGIAADRIMMEDQSTDTDENMRYSVLLIENKDDKVGIVTSNFHIFRAKLLARAKGLNHITGIPSSSDSILFVNYMVREAIGVVKDFVYGNFFR